MKLADHLGYVLSQFANKDNRIFVLDGDLADSNGADHFARAHPNRFLMGGIAEQNLVSVAAGMASCGARPFVFSFAAFLCFRAYDQLRVGLSQSKQAVTIIGSHAGGLTRRNGKTHAALNDIALMGSLPDMQVWAPADFSDVELALQITLDSTLPTYIRLPRMDVGLEFRISGTAKPNRWMRPFSNVNIVSTGLGTHWAIEVCAQAEARGKKFGLLHCPLIDLGEVIVKKLSSSKSIIVIEDHYETGGMGSLVRAKLPFVKTEIIGWPIKFQGEHGQADELRRQYGLCPSSIAKRIETHLQKTDYEKQGQSC